MIRKAYIKGPMSSDCFACFVCEMMISSKLRVTTTPPSPRTHKSPVRCLCYNPPWGHCFAKYVAYSSSVGHLRFSGPFLLLFHGRYIPST